jgi:hypothetical protein
MNLRLVLSEKKSETKERSRESIWSKVGLDGKDVTLLKYNANKIKTMTVERGINRKLT